MRPFTDERTPSSPRLKKVQAPPAFADAVRVDNDDYSPTPEGQDYVQALRHHQAGAARFLDMFRRRRASGELTDEQMAMVGEELFGPRSEDSE